jgi:hypothetical protein
MLIRDTIILFAAILFGGCASSYAPDNWLPESDKVQEEAYGGWLSLVPVNANPKMSFKHTLIAGEFIGVDSANVYLLGDTLKIIPMDSIKRSILEMAQTNKSKYTGWTVLGSVSTISHGWFLVFTLPVWIIAGTSITSEDSYSNRYEADMPPKEYWKNISKFSRFPQGIPAGLDLQILRPKIIVAD